MHTFMVWLCFTLHKRRNGSVVLVRVDVEGLGDDISALDITVLWHELGSMWSIWSWKESGGGTISEPVLSLMKHVVLVLPSPPMPLSAIAADNRSAINPLMALTALTSHLVLLPFVVIIISERIMSGQLSSMVYSLRFSVLDDLLLQKRIDLIDHDITIIQQIVSHQAKRRQQNRLN